MRQGHVHLDRVGGEQPSDRLAGRNDLSDRYGLVAHESGERRPNLGPRQRKVGVGKTGLIALERGARRLQLRLPQRQRTRVGRSAVPRPPFRIEPVLVKRDPGSFLLLQEGHAARREIGLGFLHAVQVVRFVDAEERLPRFHPPAALEPRIDPDDLAADLGCDVDLGSGADGTRSMDRDRSGSGRHGAGLGKGDLRREFPAFRFRRQNEQESHDRRGSEDDTADYGETSTAHDNSLP